MAAWFGPQKAHPCMEWRVLCRLWSRFDVPCTCVVYVCIQAFPIGENLGNFVVPSSPTRCRRKTPLSKGTPWPSTTTWDNQKHSTVSLEGCSPGLSQQCRKDHAQNFRNVVHPWPAPVCKIWSGSAAICQIYSWKIDYSDLQSVYNIGKSLLCIIDFLVVGPWSS